MRVTMIKYGVDESQIKEGSIKEEETKESQLKKRREEEEKIPPNFPPFITRKKSR